MKTVLFFSLFVIWNVFGVEGEFDGSPRIKAMKVKDITSAEMCAGACQSKADMSILDCLIWRYNKKTKRCIINFVKAKPNRKSTFGFPSSAPPKPTPTPTPPPFICPEGWPEYEGSCYKLNMNEAGWLEAETNCTSYEGGNLASIHSEEEWAFVEALIEAEQEQEGNAGLYTYWLGGKCMGNGMGWEWTDGSAWDFTKWEGSVPDGSRSRLQTFKTWIGGDLLWNAQEYGLAPYVCKIQDSRFGIGFAFQIDG